jgi:hypothetical protein
MNRFITGTNVLLVILVAIGSFSLSYSALSDLASKNGFTDWRAYVLPLVIDIGMLAFGLAVVHAHLHSTNPLRRRGLNLLYTGVTVAYNLIHAPNNLTAQGLAVIPPLTLFFTFEVLMAMVEYNIKRNQEKADNDIAQIKQEDVPEQNSTDKELATLRQELLALKKQMDSPKDNVSIRREKMLDLLQSSPIRPTQAELAKELDVSIQTIKNDLKALNGRANGTGHKLAS